MAKLKSFDPISGKEGVAYAKIGGNNEELFFAKDHRGLGGEGKVRDQGHRPAHDRS